MRDLACNPECLREFPESQIEISRIKQLAENPELPFQLGEIGILEVNKHNSEWIERTNIGYEIYGRVWRGPESYEPAIVDIQLKSGRIRQLLERLRGHEPIAEVRALAVTPELAKIRHSELIGD